MITVKQILICIFICDNNNNNKNVLHLGRVDDPFESRHNVRVGQQILSTKASEKQKRTFTLYTNYKPNWKKKMYQHQQVIYLNPVISYADEICPGWNYVFLLLNTKMLKTKWGEYKHNIILRSTCGLHCRLLFVHISRELYVEINQNQLPNCNDYIIHQTQATSQYIIIELFSHFRFHIAGRTTSLSECAKFTASTWSPLPGRTASSLEACHLKIGRL